MNAKDPPELLRRQIEQISSLVDKNIGSEEFKSWNNMNRMILDRAVKDKLKEYDAISFEYPGVRFMSPAQRYMPNEDMRLFKLGLEDVRLLFEAIIKELQLFGLKEEKIEKDDKSKANIAQATFMDGNINIALQKEIFGHVQELLSDGHYFNAVEEAYKVVRIKLKDVSGKEKATDAFSASNYERIFGHLPVDDAEKDFFEGVKFLHMAIQFLRNEKAHTPARDLDKNIAIHYIALASLAYDLINRK